MSLNHHFASSPFSPSNFHFNKKAAQGKAAEKISNFSI
jgi:hypothetical protein